MGCQALSGIAKDLTKMSAKSAVKVLVPKGDESGLFKWVALLTGSKNALKGAGFFVGGFLLSVLGFRGALAAMAGGVFIVLAFVLSALPASIGQAKKKPAFSGILSNSSGINRLSLARLALFAARDVWFVVSVPLFLASVLGWSPTQVGGFMALWVIAYGGVQSVSPILLAKVTGGHAPGPALASGLGLGLAAITALIPIGLQLGFYPALTMLGGLTLFGIVFALNSSVHSYLVLASNRPCVAQRGLLLRRTRAAVCSGAAIRHLLSARRRNRVTVGCGRARGGGGIGALSRRRSTHLRSRGPARRTVRA
jgi:hypothetical protein